MIRRSLTLWLLLATMAGVALFLVKGEAHQREEELRELHRQILDHQEAIRVLKAEWSYLNQPQRIETLARKHLDLVPLDRTHMRAMDALPEPVPLPMLRPAHFGTLGDGTAGLTNASTAGQRPTNSDRPKTGDRPNSGDRQ